MKSNKLLRSFVFAVLIAFCFIFSAKDVDAKVLDEIIDYTMTVDVLDDSSAIIKYDIQWKVLDSKSEGPLSWVQIGIPNSQNIYILGTSSNIKSASISNSGGNFAKIYFDRDYYQDEIVHFTFEINQNGLYEYNPDNDYAIYTFTPGWFDGIDVDNITIRWNADKVMGITPACTIEDGYYEWNSSLKSGEKYTVTVTYPSDAYAFTVYENNTYDDYNPSFFENMVGVIFGIIAIVFLFATICLPIAVPAVVVYVIYKSLSGFTIGKTTKITRTIIEYYPSCPNCGATRAEGEEKCLYCGTDMIKSTETVTEENEKNIEEDIKKYTTNGTYKFASNPNKYVRVHVATVPHVVSRPTSSSSNRSSSGRSHSSCAHSSCACACACACAGGGRAGCTTKDFYNTDLKLKYFSKRKDKK